MIKNSITYLMDPVSKEVRLEAQWAMKWFNSDHKLTLEEFKRKFVKVEKVGGEYKVI